MPEAKDKRHQIEDREEFTEDQKRAISKKSDERCAWCGKKVYFGYGATVDHFIPLKKGGTNDDANLVMMCYDCNQKKGSKIVPVDVAASYLKDEHKMLLEEYFENYLSSFEYISRGNLAACDIYELFFLPEIVSQVQEKARKRKKDFDLNLKRSRYLLKRAYPDDFDKICEYYIKYLKKYDFIESEDEAKENVKFWLRFGSIYYIEKNSEIASIGCITVNYHGYISFTIFTYYSTALAWAMSKGIPTCISDAIMKENRIPYLPISVNMLIKDELTPKVIDVAQSNTLGDSLACKTFIIYNDDFPKGETEEESDRLYNEGIKRFSDFIHRFYDIENQIKNYIQENNLLHHEWMTEEILGRDFFDEDMYGEVD